jgi:hypothetical protein
MGRFLYLAVLMAFLAGCVPIAADPARDTFGLSTARPDGGNAAPSDAEAAKLSWKSGQICIHGYTQTQQDAEPAEAGQQIIDRQLRCGHYDSWDFDYVHISWSNLL